MKEGVRQLPGGILKSQASKRQFLKRFSFRLFISFTHSSRRVTGTLSIDIQRCRAALQQLLHALCSLIIHSRSTHLCSLLIERSTQLNKMPFPETRNPLFHSNIKAVARGNEIVGQLIFVTRCSSACHASLNSQRHNRQALQRRSTLHKGCQQIVRRTLNNKWFIAT